MSGKGVRGARVVSSVDDTAETKPAKQDWDCRVTNVLRRHPRGQRTLAAAPQPARAKARAIAETLVRKTFRFPLRRTPIAVTDKGNAVRKAALSHREGR
jgi:hypothetical protein